MERWTRTTREMDPDRCLRCGMAGALDNGGGHVTTCPHPQRFLCLHREAACLVCGAHCVACCEDPQEDVRLDDEDGTMLG